MYLGAHMSISGGLNKSITLGESIGCGAIQIFSKNSSQWKAKPLTDIEISLFKSTWEKSAVKKILIHSGYLINLANPSENWQKSMDSMEDEMIRAEQLDIPYIVLHPGSHLKQGEEYGIKRIASSLNILGGKLKGYKLKVLLETTAGQGTNLGYTFEQLKQIISLTDEPDRYGVCLDTCHAFAAGYDIRSEQGYLETMDKFDNILGINMIMAIHLNDSKGKLSSRLDRHCDIGDGEIGLEPFSYLLNDNRLQNIPMILETPKEEDLANDVKNLNRLKELIK